jgi:hypothetical protein
LGENPHESNESLANLLISLRGRLIEEPEGVEDARGELGRLIELLFRRSKAYHHALRLYSERGNIIGGQFPDELLEELVSRYLGNTVQTGSPDQELAGSAREPAGHSFTDDPPTERFVELYNTYADEPLVRRFLLEVLEARDQSVTGERFQCQMLANAIALVLSSDYTPTNVHNELGDAINEMTNERANPDPFQPDFLREWLPLALERLKAKQPREQQPGEQK